MTSFSHSSSEIRALFARLAPYYDRTNVWLSAGQHSAWKQEVIRRIHLPPGGRLLDIGAGTGDLAIKARQRYPQATIIGGDLTPEMLRQAQCRAHGQRIRWLNTDAAHLPFPDNTFDAVMSGYLLRNVINNLAAVLREQYRVLKPGGYFVCLEATPPPARGLYWAVRFYINYLIPLLGNLLTRQTSAYKYLSRSIMNFPPAEELATLMETTGFRSVGFETLMIHSMAIHWGQK